GAYTSARTLEHATRVVDLQTHILRIAHSLSDIDAVAPPLDLPAPQIDAALASYRDPSRLRAQMLPGLAEGLRTFRQQHGLDRASASASIEAKITILVSYPTKVSPWAGHRTLPMADIYIYVKVYGAPRRNPSIKDSLWVRERELHDSIKDSDTNEILLCDDVHHTIYEGISSNFFAVVATNASASGDTATNLAVVTAPHEHVLRGTIMRMVEETCREHGIPIEYRLARIDEALIAH
ncbi:hypothetical protein SYNPS1DRAFT_17731, partial [Syncephalis pseudoplumigaleata]